MCRKLRHKCWEEETETTYPGERGGRMGAIYLAARVCEEAENVMRRVCGFKTYNVCAWTWTMYGTKGSRNMDEF